MPYTPTAVKVGPTLLRLPGLPDLHSTLSAWDAPSARGLASFSASAPQGMPPSGWNDWPGGHGANAGILPGAESWDGTGTGSLRQGPAHASCPQGPGVGPRAAHAAEGGHCPGAKGQHSDEDDGSGVTLEASGALETAEQQHDEVAAAQGIAPGSVPVPGPVSPLLASGRTTLLRPDSLLFLDHQPLEAENPTDVGQTALGHELLPLPPTQHNLDANEGKGLLGDLNALPGTSAECSATSGGKMVKAEELCHSSAGTWNHAGNYSDCDMAPPGTGAAAGRRNEGLVAVLGRARGECIAGASGALLDGGGTTLGQHQSAEGCRAREGAYPGPFNLQLAPHEGESEEDRRQKRMLSNRASARRSRQRKQHKVEDMKAQATNIAAVNADMAAKCERVSKSLNALNRENKALRTLATELSRRLQRLNYMAAARGQHPGMHPMTGASPWGHEQSLVGSRQDPYAMSGRGMAHDPYSFGYSYMGMGGPPSSVYNLGYTSNCPPGLDLSYNPSPLSFDYGEPGPARSEPWHSREPHSNYDPSAMYLGTSAGVDLPDPSLAHNREAGMGSAAASGADAARNQGSAGCTALTLFPGHL